MRGHHAGKMFDRHRNRGTLADQTVLRKRYQPTASPAIQTLAGVMNFFSGSAGEAQYKIAGYQAAKQHNTGPPPAEAAMSNTLLA